jgi:hypothetical protein
VRDRLVVPADIGGDEAQKRALASVQAQRYLNGKPPKKLILAADRRGHGTMVVNLVV